LLLKYLTDQLIDEDVYNKIEAVIGLLNTYIEDPASNPFTIVLDDPAGNSYVENLCAPNPDPKITLHYYKRTPEMNEAIGLPAEEVVQTEAVETEEQLDDNLVNDVHIFHGNCSRCSAPSETRMHIIGNISILYNSNDISVSLFL
jgi:zinc finger protein